MLKNLKAKYTKLVGKSKKHIFCVLEDIYGRSINAFAFGKVSIKLGQILFF